MSDACQRNGFLEQGVLSSSSVVPHPRPLQVMTPQDLVLIRLACLMRHYSANSYDVSHALAAPVEP